MRIGYFWRKGGESLNNRKESQRGCACVVVVVRSEERRGSRVSLTREGAVILGAVFTSPLPPM